MDYCRHHNTSSTQTILQRDCAYLSHSENSTSCVIQGPDQDLAGTHQRLRDSMSSRAEVWFGSLTKQQQKNKPPSTGKRLVLSTQSLQSTSEL